MKQLKQTSQFKKDLKRYKFNATKLEALKVVLQFLAETGVVPEDYLPHYLTGDYAGFLECHVENDFLLIWFDEANDEIRLVRLGTHAELFGKGRKR